MPKKNKKKSGGRSVSADTHASLAAKIQEIQQATKKAEPAAPAVETLSAAGAAALSKIVLDEEAPNEQKLEGVQAEYDRLAEAAKQLEGERDRAASATAERDRLASELARTRAVKEKLEGVCRSLQKQSKDVVDSEQQKREELNQRFQTSIDDIQVKLEEQGALQKDNEVLRKKLELLAKQSELREQQYAAESRHKELEGELLTTQLAQATAKFQASEAEREQLGKNEIELREQLQLYSDKFQGFQDTLTNSNEMFNNYKKEMEKMARTTKRLEKEKRELKSKSEATDASLIELANEKLAMTEQQDKLTKKNTQLESLCRTLQTQLQQARAASEAPSAGAGE